MKKRMIQSAMLSIAALSVLTTGCMNNADNRGAQQGTQMNQVRQQNQGAVNDNVRIANQAANRIVRLGGVKQANVLVTDRNAYVAAVINTNRGQMSRQLEDKIAREIRKTDPNITNVYVSTNPEFVDRINRYIADVGQGRPVAGFVEELNEMVQRIFPNAR